LDFVVGEGKEHGVTRNDIATQNGRNNLIEPLLAHTQGVENTT
jgi:hypothetical protein